MAQKRKAKPGASKKQPSKKAAARKSVPSKAVKAKKSPAKKASAKKAPAPKKQPPKKQPPKKAAPKKQPPKKSPAKAAAKKPAPGKAPSSKKASPSPARTSTARSVASPAATPPPSSVSPIDPNAIRYFTVEELVELHTALSQEFGSRNASPGVVESQFGLVRVVQVPQSTFLGREAYPNFSDKAAVLYWGILQNKPFDDSNASLALAALATFCEMNGAKIDDKVLDEKGLEKLTKKSASLDEPPEKVFGEIRRVFREAIRR